MPQCWVSPTTAAQLHFNQVSVDTKHHRIDHCYTNLRMDTSSNGVRTQFFESNKAS